MVNTIGPGPGMGSIKSRAVLASNLPNASLVKDTHCSTSLFTFLRDSHHQMTRIPKETPSHSPKRAYSRLEWPFWKEDSGAMQDKEIDRAST
jgi:hypothetical protein